MAVAAAVDPFGDAFADLVREDKKIEGGASSVKNADVPNPGVTDPNQGVAEAAGVVPPVQTEGLAPLTTDKGADGLPPGTVDATEIEGAPATPEEQEAARLAEAEATAAAAAAAAEAAKKPVQSEDQIQRLADLLARQQQGRTQSQPDATRQPAPIFNADEVAFLTQYNTDFPDVARAEAMIRRAEYNQLTAHIFREVSAYMAPRLSLLEQLADSAAYNALAQRVPDYDTQRDKVVDWVKTQPAYLQAGYNHVISHGTAEEIEDVFSRFAQATGTPASAGGAPPPVAKTAAELSPAAKAAAARLAPINGKRTAPTQAAPTTFEAAFEAFAKEVT